MNTALNALTEKLHTGMAALVNAPHHLRYLTGYPSGESWLFLTKEKAYFLTDFRYIELAEQTVRGAECIRTTRLIEDLKSLAERHGITAIVIEERETTAYERTRLAEALPLTEGHLDAWLQELRECKSEEEIALVEQAQAVTEAAFTHVLSYIREGVTEREVALELEFFMRRNGAERAAFDVIAVSGANGSQPHGIPSDKPLCRGDLLTMDFGAVVGGYHSDMTRTVAIGEISDEQRAVYYTVLQAQEAALAAVRAGVTCADGDAAARRIIEAAGYGECFGHGTGHGVGLEIHEAPSLSPRGGTTPLRAGQIVTVEPGIYVAGRFGVRIEDMVLVTADGCRNLTHATKELLVL